MKNNEEYMKNLYLADEYIIKHPSLYEEDSPWKVSKIMPLVDRFIIYLNRGEINLLDVGGGAGLIIKEVSNEIERSYDIEVNKFALDLSPSILEIQKKRNPDLRKALNEDICETSLGNKEIDLTLMIDILEHVPHPSEALEEVKRISKFVILKVPLEDNFLRNTRNFVSRGRIKQREIEIEGHVNIYNFWNLKYLIEKHAGKPLDFYFTNAFDYFRSSEHHKNRMKITDKLANFIATYMFRISPKFCSLIFPTDFIMILVKCY